MFYDLDNYLAQKIVEWRSDGLSDLMLLVTNLGSIKWVALMLIALTLWVSFQHSFKLALYSWGAIIGGIGLSELLKEIIKRPRPAFGPLALETSYSMPSSHSVLGMVYFGLCWYFWQQVSVKNRWLHRMVSLIWLGLAFLLGFSRWVIGVHYLGDVLAGWMLGGVVLLTFIAKIKKR